MFSFNNCVYWYFDVVWVDAVNYFGFVFWVCYFVFGYLVVDCFADGSGLLIFVFV